MKLTDHRTPYTRHSVTLDAEVVEQAQKYEINISLVCREALKTAVRAMKSGKTQNLELNP